MLYRNGLSLIIFSSPGSGGLLLSDKSTDTGYCQRLRIYQRKELK
ncbi:hypothetical protein GTPT_3311 [Tatumella ptyseos ATCC 33301]|uniref:Uncharacterized protein n=2 Tax=Tatumella ptyseos TaxID=82987 RepID=A0A085J991_9GAMM|nr:hypothetical protein GTPT_3311 [Tatumella ptyseos ATCC 33301]SQK72426.1 Uncharacterised protein [Tatumella ptyseos]